MDGLKQCANQMNRVSEPASRDLKPEDMPATGTIPTVIYENNAGNVGLLKTWRNPAELSDVVSFYSEVLRYKSIIQRIGEGEEVSNTNQEDLYDHIETISEVRYRIVENEEFEAPLIDHDSDDDSEEDGE